MLSKLFSTKFLAFTSVVFCATYLALDAKLSPEYSTLIGTLCGIFFGVQMNSDKTNGGSPGNGA